MPLDRTHITVASRIMVPTYPIFAGGIGLNFAIRGADLVQAGVFYKVANQIMPLRVWGCMFLVVGLVQLFAMIRRRRWIYETGLALMVGLMLVWAAVGLVGAIHDQGSYTSPLWPAFVIAACVASFRSLNVGEK